MTAIGILIGILILSVMMFVHELGHYLTGRRLGFIIEEFSIFMGPVLFQWERHGIKYNIKLLPIGASVRFAGETPDDAPADAGQAAPAAASPLLQQGAAASGESRPVLNADRVYAPDEPGLFFNRPKWARALVIGTGPAINLLSGILAFLLMFSIFGYTIPVLQGTTAQTLAADAGLAAGDRILSANDEPIRTTLDYAAVDMFADVDVPVNLVVRNEAGETREVVLQPRVLDQYRLGVTLSGSDEQGGTIAEVDAQSNGGQPVLQAGDIIVSANGIAYADATAFRETVNQASGQPISLAIIRAGEKMTVAMTATLYQDYLPRGISFAGSRSFPQAVGQSFLYSWSIVKVTVRSIGMMFTGAVRPQDTLSGPVGVVGMITDVVEQKQPLSEKIYQLLWMFALISVSLGFMNLLPIPPLDGNHLLLIIVEAFRRKPLSMRIQTVIGVVGFALIISLALLGLLFDIMRLTGN